MILRMLRDVPASGWAIVALSALRAAALSALALAVARGVDLTVGAGDAGPSWLAALAALVVAAVAEGVSAAVPSRSQPREEAAWRRLIALKSLASSLDADVPVGERVSSGGVEVERFAHYRASFLGPLVAGAVVPAVVLVVIAAAVSWGVALGLAVCVALAPVVIAWFLGRFRASSGRYRGVSARLSATFLETMRVRHTMRMLDAGAQRRAVLARQAADVRDEVMALLRRNQLVILVTDAVFGILALTAVGVLAVAGVRDGWLTPGLGIALLLLSGLLREPVDRLGRSFYVGLAGRAAGDRLRADLADADPPRRGPARWRLDDALAPGGDGALDADALLTLRDARVARGGVEVVTNADLAIPARGVVAVVGPSGAGKSSLAYALAGLIPADGIWLGSERATPDGLRASVAYIPQRAVLFPGTVRDNLLLARPDATDEQMHRALESAGFRAHHDLARGLDTPVREGAAGVSGGQAQRISIARALLTGRPILVADEATAHLDPETSERVIETLEAVGHERSVVMITHRHDEARIAGSVAVVEAGRITRVGRPADVLATGDEP